MRHITLSVSIFLAAASARADYSEKCGSASKPIDYKYCVVTAEGSQSRDVIYYLHGSGGDEHEWSFVFPGGHLNFDETDPSLANFLTK